MDKYKNKSDWRWNADTWISFCAIIIALIGIVLAFVEGLENREHNRLLVRPKIILSAFYNQDKVALTLSSVGLGPAILKWFEVKVDGESETNWKDVLFAIGIHNESVEYKFT